MPIKLPTAFRAAAAALALVLSVPATTAAALPPLDLRYVIYWGGLRVADVALRYEEDAPAVYHAELNARTRGLADVLVQYLGDAQTQGLLSGGNGLAPVSYRADYRQRKATRSTVVNFDPETGNVTGIEMLKRGAPKQTEVPESLRVDVVDPLTAIFSLRHQTAAALAGGPQRFSVGVFDGSRRYDLEAQLLGRGTTNLDGRDHPVVQLRLDMVPLAGFDRDEMDRDRNSYIIAHLSDDERLVPLRLQTHGAVVATVVRLTQDCSNGVRCPSVTN